ncbi:MAG TPA: hypothetical protein VMV92_03325 [Streptosporangiaceae bacterium]|nr:hypothetical protein [Streptosporangiaceae bacterium]
MTDAEQISGGHVRLRAGTLYAALDRLRADGLVEIADSRPSRSAGIRADERWFLAHQPRPRRPPHMSADFRGWERALTDLFLAQLSRYRAGQPLANVVDKELGFVVRG